MVQTFNEPRNVETTLGGNASSKRLTEINKLQDTKFKQDPEQDLSAHEERPYPKEVLFIVANEFCERFSFFGIRTIFVLYFSNVLKFSNANTTITYHLFTSFCYITPILGAILADSVLGRFKTIFYLSIVYFFGELVFVFGSVFWNLGTTTIIITSFGLFFIGLGTGGIKPCVVAFGIDQFLPHEVKWHQSFMSAYYGSITLGSTMAMFLIPVLRSDVHCVDRPDCYPLAFGVPCLLMLVSILVFLMGRDKYFRVPLPEENVILEFFRCIWLALERKIASKRMIYSVSSSSVIGNEVKPVATKKLHWLYLASDKFDTQTIEQFRRVLGILVVFLPFPLLWALTDQFGSTWVLQASRMDGHIWNTNYVVQPDQMMLCLPLFTLVLIPAFDVFIYPSLSHCNLLTKPVQRMTVGGIFAAAAFVLSALIEMRIQQFHPVSSPPPGQANLMLVNGFSDCSMNDPVISYVQIPSNLNKTLDNIQHPLDILEPLNSKQVNLLSANNYKLRFTLCNSNEYSEQQSSVNISGRIRNCPFESRMREYSFASLADRSANLLYLDQGNGKIAYKLFNDSLDLPVARKARVRLLYASFENSTQTDSRLFSLVQSSSLENVNHTTSNLIQFRPQSRDGQVLISDYLDVDVPTKGDTFVLRTNDNLIDSSSAAGKYAIELKPGTRNLIIVNQRDAKTVEVKVEVLQDNEYRISIFYQIGPYLLVSVSDVMFTITGIGFSYSMAPENMKSVVLAVWSTTIAIGNVLTAVFEWMNFFANTAHNFLFYAAIVTIDMILLEKIGRKYQAQFES